MTSATRYLDLLSSAGDAAGLESAAGEAGGPPDKAELLDRLRAEIDYVQRKAGITVDPGDLSRLLAEADDGLQPAIR